LRITATSCDIVRIHQGDENSGDITAQLDTSLPGSEEKQFSSGAIHLVSFTEKKWAGYLSFEACE
jgi:hypothetical protein